MKHLIILSLILSSFTSLAQTDAEKAMYAELESLPYRESSEIPQSFIVASNFSNTFIKDSANYIQAVAHGYDDTELQGFNCKIEREKNTNSYKVFTPEAGECRIALYGVNTTTKKKICLGTYIYEVVDKVYHSIKIDQTISGGMIGNKISSIGCCNLHYWNYQEEITLLEWTMKSEGKTISGKGEKTDKSLESWLKTIPSGQAIVVTGKAKSNFLGEFDVISVFIKGDF
jgi:hypothetical protein